MVAETASAHLNLNSTKSRGSKVALQQDKVFSGSAHGNAPEG